MVDLAVCACLGYDAPYLAEWIEFHRLVGAKRFFLYNNGDREVQRELLAPYCAEGTVVLHEWPGAAPQIPAYGDCLQQHRKDARWIAFIDTDEFLFSPLGQPLPELLTEYEQWPAVGACRLFFGTSGHVTKPPGLVVESYRRVLTAHVQAHFVKSIVNPERAERPINPHLFRTDGDTVDELHRPVSLPAKAQSFTAERLRINHYWTKSEEELEAKFARLRPDTGEPYPPGRTRRRMRIRDQENSRPDEAILTYLPALREALARR